MLMVAEMTANLSMLAPAMIAVSLSYLLVGQTTIYTSQLETRADSPAHRLQFSFPLLSTLAVRQAMAPVRLSLRETQTVAEAAALLASQRLPGAPVLNERDGLVGVLTHTDIERVSEAERSERRVAKAMNRDVLTIHADASLDEALEEVTTGRVHWAPVVETQALAQNRRVLGIVAVTDIVRLYRKTLAKDTHRMRGLVEGTVMQEVVVRPGMPFVECALREAALPAGCLVVSIRRGPELLFPSGGMIIKAGDTITVLMSPQGEARWQDYMNMPVAQHDSAPASSALSAPPGRTQ
jgi:CIC family chloride channel protein